MRVIKLITLLLGLSLLVSASSENIDNGYSSRKLAERELRRGSGARSSSGRSSGVNYSKRGSKSSNSKSKSSYYDKNAYMGTLYYYNNHYNR